VCACGGEVYHDGLVLMAFSQRKTINAKKYAKTTAAIAVIRLYIDMNMISPSLSEVCEVENIMIDHTNKPDTKPKSMTETNIFLSCLLLKVLRNIE
jgi:hypothetical protein